MVTNENMTNYWFKQYLTDIVFQDKFEGRTSYKVRRDNTTEQDTINANCLTSMVLEIAYNGVPNLGPEDKELKEEDVGAKEDYVKLKEEKDIKIRERGQHVQYALETLFEVSIINAVFQDRIGKPEYTILPCDSIPGEEIEQVHQIEQAHQEAKDIITKARAEGKNQEWMIENATAEYILKP